MTTTNICIGRCYSYGLIMYWALLHTVNICLVFTTQECQLLSMLWWCYQMEIFSALLAFCMGNSPVTGEFPHKGQWSGALMFSLICTWINGWVSNCETGETPSRSIWCHCYEISQVLPCRGVTIFAFGCTSALSCINYPKCPLEFLP